MTYEIYIDSLFLVNFVMNFYLLMLMNRGVRRTATRRRLMGGALIGALFYCFSLILPYVPALLKLAMGTGIAGVCMVKWVFRPVDIKSCFKLTEILIGYSFLMGGALLFIMRYLQGITDLIPGAAAVVGAGGMLYLLFSYLMERRKREPHTFCKVTLVKDDLCVCITALVDTGNHLTEPISGKPVSVVAPQVMERLWPEGVPEFYRAVPYHSVGCAHGILKGYEIPEMKIEAEGVLSTLHHVYLGVGEHKISAGDNYEMILHPKLMG
ncbi:MAG: hypothetical protein E7293_01185 [Lachnospiraceae bacterium]|nr:hypothetical protein [Lachnospiraceae bacterium]